MARIFWDSADRDYESGVDRGVFYPSPGPGEAWNGLTTVDETPYEPLDQICYIDGVKVRVFRSEQSFSATISAYTYPDSFSNLIMQYRPRKFGLSYRVKTADSYKIHLVYNATPAPSTTDYEQKDPSGFSWFITTIPVSMPEGIFTAHLVVDASVAYPSTVAALEDILYGTDEAAARLPSPSEVLSIFEADAILKVTDNGDGTFTVTGPDEAIQMIDPTTFQITWDSAIYIDSVTYKISSL